MRTPVWLVALTLDEQHYALPLPAVERVVRAAQVTPLPRAPEIVLGIVNARGRVIPVIDVRKRFRLPERRLALTDRMVIARSARRPVALIVDAVTGVLAYSEQAAVGARDIAPGLEHVAGVVKLEDGLILIHDLDEFLSLGEETALDRAMEDG